MVRVNDSAAGPCCQRHWLATAHKLDATAALSMVQRLNDPRPISRRTLNRATPRSAAIAPAAFFDIPKQRYAALASQPGDIQSRISTWGSTRGTAKSAGAMG